MLTWHDLVMLEPRLLDLERSIRREGPYDRDVWYKIYKPDLRLLVGFDREKGPEILQTAEAYDVAYNHLYRLYDR